MSGKPILLIYDGHGSHDTLGLIELAQEHNIILFCLPPHTTHKLQPLDVGVFGPFSRAWTDRCDQIVEDTGEEMPRENFVKEYMDVRRTTFKESTIRAAWKKSGCWPIDRTVFKDDDYAPSILTSTSSSHVPDSFPVPCPVLPIEPDFYEYPPDLDEDQHDENDPTLDPTLISHLDSDSAIQSPLNTTIFPLPHRPESLQVTRCEQAPKPLPTPAMCSNQRGPSRRSRIHHSEDEKVVLRSRVATLEAQCAMARCEIQDLKRRGNAKDSRSRKRQKLNVEARCLTSEEGLKLAREHQAVRDAQEQKKHEAQEQRAAKEAERERLRLERDLNEPFTGALTTKTKPDLQDIAQALGLLTSGGKKDLFECITHDFDVNPDL